MKENLTHKITWITSIINLLEDAKRDYRQANENYGNLVDQNGEEYAESHVDGLRDEIEVLENRIDKAVTTN